jgi:hypothetical protein
MASAESISERCEMDLSPGTETVPCRGPLEEKDLGDAIMKRLLTAAFTYGKARPFAGFCPASLILLFD